MNAVEPKDDNLPLAEKLATASEALDRYRERCFWFLPDRFEVTRETLPTIIKGLRSDGDRAAFLIAAQLCR